MVPFGGRCRVQGAEYQVPRLRCRERQTDRLEVTHLAHENNVRVLAQRGSQRFCKAERVAVHFTLIHQASLALVHKFNRVLNGEDAVVAVVIDEVDHRSERGRLT